MTCTSNKCVKSHRVIDVDRLAIEQWAGLFADLAANGENGRSKFLAWPFFCISAMVEAVCVRKAGVESPRIPTNDAPTVVLGL